MDNQLNPSSKIINLKLLSITSILMGFFLIPIHEFGHVLCDWISGHPAAMSYARDYLLDGSPTQFIGVLGGPSLPLIVALFAIIQVYRNKNISIFYPIAILGSFDRLLLYISGSLPSDERDLANFAGWNLYSFKYIFCSLEILILALVVYSLFRFRLKIINAFTIFIIPLLSFIVGATIGILLVERYLFTEQYFKQFG